MLEPVQGEGGVNIPPPDYLKAVRQWCDEKGLLLILDEVQTGLGRLGTLFGYEQFDVEPDVMTLAKGLGGGVPIGAFLTKEDAAVLEPGDHGSTFGGNPLACAAANASTRFMIEHDVPENAKRMGAALGELLTGIEDRRDSVKAVRGMGLLHAVDFASEISAGVLAACNEGGLLLNATGPATIRLMPPLTVTEDEVATAMERLEAGIVEAEKGAAE